MASYFLALRQIQFTLPALCCGLVFAQQPAEHPSINRGTVTILSAYGGSASHPVSLAEVSPGEFIGLTDAMRVFRMTSAGVVTVVRQIQADGPYVGWAQGVNGRFYGAAATREQAFNLSFDANGDVRYYYDNTSPSGFSVATAGGKLYGIAPAPGPNKSTFSAMNLAGALTSLYNFGTESPYILPILASDGNFYGLLELNYTASVYRVTPQGDLKILVTYPDGVAGKWPPGSFSDTLIQASNGKLYGTAAVGGANGAGALFEVSLAGSGYKVLKEFDHLSTGAPNFLLEADDGNIYGIAQGEPQLGPPSTLFRLTLDGKYEALQHIGGSSEACRCAMIQGSDGKLYGTAVNGAIWVWDLGLAPPQPHITGLFPSSGAAGTTVVVTGKQLLGVTAVSFNGTLAASFSNIGGQFVSATVPTGATAGPVTLTNMNGTATSPAPFAVQ